MASGALLEEKLLVWKPRAESPPEKGSTAGQSGSHAACQTPSRATGPSPARPPAPRVSCVPGLIVTYEGRLLFQAKAKALA